MDTRDVLRAALTEIGRKGGKAGRGEAKRRGDSAYYRALRAKVKTYPVTLTTTTGKKVRRRVTIPED